MARPLPGGAAGSALGRVLALTGMIAITAVLGGVAIRPAEVEDPQRNWLFLLIERRLERWCDQARRITDIQRGTAADSKMSDGTGTEQRSSIGRRGPAE